jgi:hypothetical protein
MSEQTPTPGPGMPPSGYRDWREQRRAERWARRQARWQRHAGRPYGWTAAAFLILLGIILLVQNLGYPVLKNWWALFILIPAFWAFVFAWENFREGGQWRRGGTGSLVAGILLTLLTFVLLFNLSFGLFWPVLLIVGGLALLATTFLPV